MALFLAMGLTALPIIPASAACDSSQARSVISFAETVEPLFQNSCALASCHVKVDPPEDLNLQSGFSYWNLVNVRSLKAPDIRLIEPGDPEASYLVHKLRGNQIAVGGEGVRMPFELEPLTDDQIAQIVTWIRDCSPNN